jgi:hypothetical protein
MPVMTQTRPPYPPEFRREAMQLVLAINDVAALGSVSDPGWGSCKARLLVGG